ncbi:LacI family transcriptional regulator [Vibrio lamellibrachiae]|uniref:LacI family DNA-binding transcriptional regulator n=1 Tax=Vibrio lamellibrachiae TaxID=2910253 RepID=UPI003D151CCF
MNFPKSTMNSAKVAQLAGVSRSTVSKVINNYPDIPEKTRNKVLAVINDNKYIPNTSAQILKGKAQTVLALYIYNTKSNDPGSDFIDGAASPYIMRVIASFLMAANAQGYRLMIEHIQEGEVVDEDLIQKIRSHFLSQSISAAVIVGLTEDAGFIDKLADENFPIAVIDRVTTGGNLIRNILTDDENGSYKATQHLIEQGFSQIAFVSGNSNKLSSKKRLKGYTRALEYNQLSPILVVDIYSEYTKKSGYLSADHILSMEPRPDAIVCASDSLAYGLIQRLHEVDEQYLSKVGIIGFDDSFFNEYQRPALSSVKVNFNSMASITVNALLHPDINFDLSIATELVIRDSSVQR